MARAKEIVEKWQNYVPPAADRQDVEKVIFEYFPESEIKKKSGSHFIVLKESMSIDWARMTGKSEAGPFNYKGEISIPVKGKKVKNWYINKLLRAIEFKEKLDEFFKKEG